MTKYRVTYKLSTVKHTFIIADNVAAAAAKFLSTFRGAKIWGIRPA